MADWSLDGRTHRTMTRLRHPKHRFTLLRVRLGKGGYDDCGHYWGTGEPLWYYYNDAFGDAGMVEGYFRALTRDDAKAEIRARFPGASFWR